MLLRTTARLHWCAPPLLPSLRLLTPAQISSILQNSGVIFSVPFAKLVLRDRKVYGEREPIIAACLIISSVLISLAPTFEKSLAGGNRAPPSPSDGSAPEDGSSESGSAIIAWAFVYICGLVPNSLMNTLQQLYFLRIDPLGEEVSSPHEEWRTFLRALLTAQTAQMVAYPFLFWVDFIPNFGFSASGDNKALSAAARWKTMWEETSLSLACSLGGFTKDARCTLGIPFYAWGFVLTNLTGYFAATLVNKESATFNMLCMVLVTSFTSLIWEIPNAEPGDANGSTKLWSVLLSLVLCFTGSGLWKLWEARTPATEQYAICAVLAERLEWEHTKIAEGGGLLSSSMAPAEEAGRREEESGLYLLPVHTGGHEAEEKGRWIHTPAPAAGKGKGGEEEERFYDVGAPLLDGAADEQIE